jgi:hypothetical protein
MGEAYPGQCVGGWSSLVRLIDTGAALASLYLPYRHGCIASGHQLQWWDSRPKVEVGTCATVQIQIGPEVYMRLAISVMCII